MTGFAAERHCDKIRIPAPAMQDAGDANQACPNGKSTMHSLIAEKASTALVLGSGFDRDGDGDAAGFGEAQR